jgi:hypothetical protein
MGGAKPWQYVVLALGFAAIVFTVVFTFTSGSKGPDLANRVTVVDVKSGQLFVIDPSKTFMGFPMTNPETKTATLYPVFQEEGQSDWKIQSQYVSIVRSLPDAQTSAMADKREGVVKPTTEQPKPLSQS